MMALMMAVAEMLGVMMWLLLLRAIMLLLLMTAAKTDDLESAESDYVRKESKLWLF